jgi:hypothetical protein
LAIILGKNEPGERISLEELKSMLTSLSTQLATRASQEKEYYYFVIDGLEYAFTGTTGNRIIDELPLRTYPNSPYILFSCRTDQIEELPSKIRDALQIEPLPFDKKQTQIFLDGLGFSLQEIDIIHEQCEGVAGYLRIVKNVKLSDPSAKSEQFQPDFNKLVNQHLDVVLKQNYEVDAEILSTLAASPTSVPYQVLIKMINVDEVMVNESLKRLAGLVYYDANKYRVSYKSEFAKKAYVIRLNDRVQHYRRKLITCIEEGYESDEDLLLMLLYRDDQDYEGFQQKISNQAILSIIGEVGDVSSVLKKLSIATEMATNPNRNDLKGLIKWTHGVLTAKSFIMHAVDQDEIKALLSIKNIEAALGRIYALPETVSKIRLLARAYLAMKEDNQRVSKAAKDELEAMVSNLKTDHLDREFIQDLALDLLPIVPDTAISLLEKTIGKIKSRSIFDAVIDETPKNQDDEDMGSSKPKPKKRVLRGDFAIMFSHWLRQLSFGVVLESEW